MIELLARLDRWLAAHRPDYAAVLAPPRDTSAPEPARTLHAWHDGQTKSAWSLVGSFWLVSFDEAERHRRDNAKAAVEENDPEWWHDDWFPVLDDGQGNVVCVADGGTLIQYFHDDPSRDVIAPSLDALVAAIVEGLEAGILVVTEDARWQGCIPTDDSAWAEIRRRHGIEIPLAYARTT